LSQRKGAPSDTGQSEAFDDTNDQIGTTSVKEDEEE